MVGKKSKPRYRTLSSLTAFVFLVGILCVSPTTVRADDAWPTVPPPTNDVAGLSSCFVGGGGISTNTCGDKLTVEQTLFGNKVAIGSIVKCASGGLLKNKTTCVITSPSGSSQVVHHDTLGSGGIGTTENCGTDASGNPAACKSSNDLKVLANTAINSAVGALGDVAATIFGPLAMIILSIATLILGAAGILFNWVIIRTVFQFATYFGNSAGLLVAWGVLRDIGNIVLLFGFIFLGVTTILNVSSGHGHSGSSNIPRLIIFALLLNFSLFAAEAVIDTSNAFSSVFATQAGQGCSATMPASECANKGISGQVISMAGVQTVWGQVPDFSDPQRKVVILIGLSIFVSITAVVLIAGAIMLISRAVVLCLLVVTSPIGFAGLAIPQLEGLAKEWWHRLIAQAFFAPVFILAILVSLKIVSALTPPNTSLADALFKSGGANDSGNFQIMLVFAVVIGFMIASLMIAKKMGAAGASFAIKTAGGAVFGTYGFVGRRTVGQASALGAAAVRKTKFGQSGFGRLTATTLDKGAAASFDARTNKVFGGALKGTGLDLGKPNKTAAHGYHGIEEKAKKERVDYAKTLKGRRETRQEFEERKTGAVTRVTDKEADVTAADLKRKNAQAEALKQDALLVQLQEQARKKPTDTALAARVTQQQQLVTQRAKEAVDAEEALTHATEELAKARADEVKIREGGIGNIDEKAHQKSYAAQLEESPHGGIPTLITVGPHADHAAAKLIKTYAGMSKTERALAQLKEGIDAATEKEDEHHEEDKHDADHGGGGGHAPAGGGGGHAH